jgi:hypothetical protein
LQSQVRCTCSVVVCVLSIHKALGLVPSILPIPEFICSHLGIYIINLKRTWEKLLLAARAIVAIENPADVSVISSRNTGQVCRTVWG